MSTSPWQASSASQQQSRVQTEWSTPSSRQGLHRPRSRSDAALFAGLTEQFMSFGTVLSATQMQSQRRDEQRPPLNRVLRDIRSNEGQDYDKVGRASALLQDQPVQSGPAWQPYNADCRRGLSSLPTPFSSESDFRAHQTPYGACEPGPSRDTCSKWANPTTYMVASTNVLLVSSGGAGHEYVNPGAGEYTEQELLLALPSRADGRRRWQPWEDEIVREAVAKQGPQSWGRIVERLPHRSANQIRLRWRQSLGPDLEKSAFTPEEDAQILRARELLGNQWKLIASTIGGRHNFNDVKNRWYNLRKRRKHSETSNDTKSAELELDQDEEDPAEEE
ncbi:Transcription factor [Porphyridium purpureum]|uniref:Transcription factor n=1 Tax=Porphyridium purpureum TaxID=35688 RepID=A0A5J4YU21_PORPP|nr:Transcription factor [Porphyridium purpureum]|eukprot:POR2652..scf227_4